MLLYPRTHLQDLGAEDAGNGLFKLPDSSKDSPVSELGPIDVTMDRGGLYVVFLGDLPSMLTTW